MKLVPVNAVFEFEDLTEDFVPAVTSVYCQVVTRDFLTPHEDQR
jgi:hypothetical protein